MKVQSASLLALLSLLLGVGKTQADGPTPASVREVDDRPTLRDQYNYLGRLLAELKSNPQLREHLNLSDDEMWALEKSDRIPFRSPPNGADPPGHEQRRLIFAQVLGKERFRRLQQVYGQRHIQNKRDLYHRLMYERSVAGPIFSKNQVEHFKQLQTDYFRHVEKLGQLHIKKKIDDDVYQRACQEAWNRWYQQQETIISPSAWKRFQIHCGEKFFESIPPMPLDRPTI